MTILLDHGVPKAVARYLTGHAATRANQMGWAKLTNGELIKQAERAGFDLIISTDRNIRYQQNLKLRRIAILVLSNQQWPNVRQHIQLIKNAVTPTSQTAVSLIPYLRRNTSTNSPSGCSNGLRYTPGISLSIRFSFQSCASTTKNRLSMKS